MASFIPPLRWNDANRWVDLLDQTKLPVEETWLAIETPEAMHAAIKRLSVRGAPAIGIAAAYGVVLAVRAPNSAPNDAAKSAIDLLVTSRPTAVNLFWALERMHRVLRELGAVAASEEVYDRLLAEAHAIRTEDEAAGRKMGIHGLSVLRDDMTVLTHCHAGGVATSGYGTALAPFLLAQEQGRRLNAYVDETRPLLQGARITAWELQQAGIPATLITDSMAGHVMQQGTIDAVIVGADRIAANGDVANKIGTYTLAVLADVHGIPFYVAAPRSTIDYATATGAGIVIEERTADEVTHGFGRQTAPKGIAVYNPAFDVTPAHLVSAIITEFGVVRPPYTEHLEALRNQSAAE